MVRRVELFLALAALPGAAGAYLWLRGAPPLPTALALYGVLLGAATAFLFRTHGEYRALARAAAAQEAEVAAFREEIQQRVDVLSAQREIGLILNEDVDFKAVLDRVLGVTCDTLGGAVEMWMRDGESMSLRAARDHGTTVFEAKGREDARIRRCFDEGRMMILEDDHQVAALAPLESDREIVGVVRVTAARQPGRTTFLAKNLPEFSKFLALALKTPDLYTRAVQDGLTGLWTKRHFLAQIEEMMETARRYGEPLSIIMVDIDHFKKVNDTHGHQAGDKVLKAVAEILRKRVRGGMAFRYGGEEMSVLLPKAGTDGAAAVAERLRKAIESAKPGGLRVTASFGVAELGGDDTWEGLVERADQALYQAKQGGRNRVMFAPPPAPPAQHPTRRWTRSA